MSTPIKLVPPRRPVGGRPKGSGQVSKIDPAPWREYRVRLDELVSKARRAVEWLRTTAQRGA